jgi:hypothetical protein
MVECFTNKEKSRIPQIPARVGANALKASGS